jgi:FtsP/CotA-like multicopper oxidase with cupredoxin domain
MKLSALRSFAKVRSAASLALFFSFFAISLIAVAATLDYFGPPPAGDPSAWTGPIVSESLADDLNNQPPVYKGAIEGGPTGTAADQGVTGFIGEDELDGGGKYDIPTGGRPSPLFGAQPFSQKILRFEEFGTHPLDPTLTPALSFPRPTVGSLPALDPFDLTKSGPDPIALDAFLAEPGLAPFPREFSNTDAENPWKADIEGFLGRALDTPPAEGRPPGRGWAHQRWNEFYPVEYFKTAQTGARDNSGFRDAFQRHGYGFGEWGSGGLYHNTTGQPGFEGTTAGIGIRFHPKMPIQDHKSLWTFDGTLPPKLLKVRTGQPLVMRHYNALPIDVTANRGFGMHTITTHEHNGHSPAESDGFAGAFYFPGQFYDYRWPIALAGYDTINTDASDPRAAFPCEPGESLFINDLNPGVKSCENGIIRVRGDWRQTMSTHWFHDHMLDFTAPNVYKGNAAMMNYYSALDRGHESHDCHYEDPTNNVNFCFPSGNDLPWGNRDYDINLLIAGKAWDQVGQLWFNIFNKDGFLGDRMLVNWLYKPYLDVRQRRYRLRILNGSVARYFKLALVQEVQGHRTGEIRGRRSQGVSWNRIPFHLIANDGNIMEHAIPFDGSTDLDGDGDADEHKGILPVQAIAERYDIVVDFAAHGLQPGDKLYFVNLLEHKDGKVVEGVVDLEAVLRESYKAELEYENGEPARWVDGDPVVGKFLEFRIQEYAGTDTSMNPSAYEPGGMKMIPLVIDRDDPEQMAAVSDARRRTFTFGRSSGTDAAPWTIKTDGGSAYTADTRRVSVAPQLATGPTEAGYAGDGTTEVWRIETGGGWSHPIHIHFEEGVILYQDGEEPPVWNRYARKDVFRIGPEEEAARDMDIYYNFREFAGSYVEHCHNTSHEDHAMLLRWDLEQPGQVEIMPAPIPTWDGVEYVDSIALPTFRSGDGFGLQN